MASTGTVFKYQYFKEQKIRCKFLHICSRNKFSDRFLENLKEKSEKMIP